MAYLLILLLAIEQVHPIKWLASAFGVTQTNNDSCCVLPVNAPGISRRGTYPPCAPQRRWRGQLTGGIADTHPDLPLSRLDTAA